MIYRQGDVLIIATDEQVEGKKVVRDRGRVILAYGEVTGHAHAIHAKECDLYAPEHDAELADRFLSVLAGGGVDLVHEEHDTITIPRGTYIVRQQREYTPEAVRSVAD